MTLEDGQRESRSNAALNTLDLRANLSGNASLISQILTTLCIEPFGSSIDESESTDDTGSSLDEDTLRAIQDLVSEYSTVLLNVAAENDDLIVRLHNKVDKRHARSLKGFRRRLQKTWRDGLRYMRLVGQLSFEIGAEFNAQYAQTAFDTEDVLFENMRRLHARACRIFQEIELLLAAGFSDGGHARWRALHENAVAILFLAKHGERAARLFSLHQVAQVFPAMQEYQRVCNRLGEKEYSNKELQSAEVRHASIIEKYGKHFVLNYGWAARILGIDRCGLERLERDVELDHWRPYYRMASLNIHPYPRATTFGLGLSEHGEPLLLAGPSNAGLADPGHCSCLSLNIVTSAFLYHWESPQLVALTQAVKHFTDLAGEAFLQSHELVENETKRRCAGAREAYEYKPVDLNGMDL